MRTKEFEVPTEIIAEVAELIAEHELTNEINGVNEEGEILLDISYEQNQREAVLEIMELIDDHNEEQE